SRPQNRTSHIFPTCRARCDPEESSTMLRGEYAALKVVLISTYELGHQPFGLASPAAWLRRNGAEVVCLDLSRQSLSEDAVRSADVVAFYVPIHPATRLAIRLTEPIRRLNP